MHYGISNGEKISYQMILERFKIYELGFKNKNISSAIRELEHDLPAML
jgi:hypothetical protein